MFLHHSVTIFLYGFSYYGNFTVAGSIIMYLHDLADIFTSGVRTFTETNCNKLSTFFAVMMTLSWLYTRLIVFPIVIYETAFVTTYADQNDVVQNTLLHLKIFLIVLLVLHVYWFYVLLKALKKYITRGKIEDN